MCIMWNFNFWIFKVDFLTRYDIILLMIGS